MPQLREVQDDERRELGEEFRLARQRRGDDLAAVAAKLRIRAEHLQAIEDGRFDDLPGKTYAIGFLRTYAGHLGLDADDVLARYRRETRTDTSASTLYFPEPIKEARRPRTWLVALALILLGGVYAAWYYGSAERRVAQQVWPSPERLSSTATTSSPAGGPSADQGTTPATAPAADNTGFGAPATVDNAGTATAPAATPPATATTEQPTQASGPATATDQAPTVLRGGTQTGADTAVAAIGPRDWRSEPAPTDAPAGTAANPPATAPDGTAAAPGFGLDRNGTWTAQRPDPRDRSADFGSLIAAARNKPDAPAAAAPAAQPAERAATTPAEGTYYAAREPGATTAASAGGPQQALATASGVTLHARNATWIQLENQNGNVLISRTLQAGESYQVPAESGLTLTTGNAGGLDIEINGNHSGPIGPVGAVRRHISIDRLRADAR